MEQINQDRLERLLNMMRWLLDNPGEMEMLCDPIAATARDVQESMIQLEKQGYYEWIPLLLLKHRD